jgi:glucose-1-phosphate thymidylyltransferase
MKVLILAAGYATRLYPRTRNFPKPLLEVDKRPIIEYLLDKIERLSGVSEVVVVTNDRFAKVFEIWAKRLNTRLPIRIVNDRTRTPQERLGAVGDMELVFKKESYRGDFLVLGGDNFFQESLDDFLYRARQRPSSTTIGVFDIKRKSEASRFGVVSLDKSKRVADFAEKPAVPKSSLIAMCVYYFPQKSLKHIKEYMAQPGYSSDAAGAYIDWLSRAYTVYGYRFGHVWVDIGNNQTYDRINKVMKEKGAV